MITPTAAPSRPPYWPKGVPLELRVPQVTLDDYLYVAARRYPDKPAIIFAGASITYARLLAQVEALAGYCQQRLGVAHGERVLLQSQNCPQFVVACYALFRIGAVVVPINAMSTGQELRYYAENSGARIAIAAQELLPSIRPSMDEGRLTDTLVIAYSDVLPARLSDSLPDLLPLLPEAVTAPRALLPAGNYHGFQAAIDAGLQPAAHSAKPQDLALIPYTSGTTGHPKGCMHTHSTLLAPVTSAIVWRGLHADTVSLAVAPLFHMLGLQAGMNAPILSGSTIVMMPRWNALLAAQLIERHRVTAWTAPPSMVVDLLTQAETHQIDLSSLALLTGGGAAMPEAVSATLKARFGLIYNEAYGLTETAAFLHANPLPHGKRQCLGIPTQSVHSMIVDPQTLEELPRGEVGELVTSGPQVMQGYWRNDEATRASFFERHGRRYFRTGDLATVDKDGYYFMRDRLKRMINLSGYKVWPAEVENMLYAHPAVQEACVIGVADPKRGETVKALLVLKPSARPFNKDDFIAWCREQMAAYKVPRIVECVEQLPKSATGKIQWRALQEQAQAQEQVQEQVRREETI